jgi:pyrimidine-nucleoside phosphorylase
MIELQGGDASYLTPERMNELVAVKRRVPVVADRDGYVVSMAAEEIGETARLLGAGRLKKGDPIDPAVGLVMKVRCGAKVSAGDSLAVLYVNDETNLEEAIRLLKASIRIEPDYHEPEPMVYGVIG